MPGYVIQQNPTVLRSTHRFLRMQDARFLYIQLCTASILNAVHYPRPHNPSLINKAISPRLLRQSPQVEIPNVADGDLYSFSNMRSPASCFFYKFVMSKLFEAKCVNFQTPKKYHRVWGKAQHVCTNSAWIPAQSGLSLLCTKVFPVYRVWTQPPLNKFSPCSNNRDIVCRRVNVTYIT